MGRVTQHVEPGALADLVARGHAALAFERNGAIDVLPVAHRVREGRHWIGLACETAPDPGALVRGVLLADDGSFWFELRAVTWRGRIEPGAAPAGVGDDLVWFVFLPEAAVAWDYGALREEADR